MGMERDWKRRKTLVRRDDESRRNLVDRARKIIFEKGNLVNSAAVERLLKDQSLVPVKASTNPTSPTLYIILTAKTR